MPNFKSEIAPHSPTTFERHVRDTLGTLSEHLRMQISSCLDAAAKELTAAAEADRVRAIEQGGRAARAEVERDFTERTVRLFAALDETVATLKREIGVADDRPADSVSTLGSR
jgi:hypothetical protein